MEFILSAWNILNFRFHGSFSIIKLSIFVIRFSYVFLIPPPNVIERYLYDIGAFIVSENITVLIQSFLWSVFSPNPGKYGPKTTLFLDSFHWVRFVFQIFVTSRLDFWKTKYNCWCYGRKQWGSFCGEKSSKSRNLIRGTGTKLN